MTVIGEEENDVTAGALRELDRVSHRHDVVSSTVDDHDPPLPPGQRGDGEELRGGGGEQHERPFIDPSRREGSRDSAPVRGADRTSGELRSMVSLATASGPSAMEAGSTEGAPRKCSIAGRVGSSGAVTE